MNYHHVFVWDVNSTVETFLENIIKYPRDTHVYDAGCEYDLGKIAHTGERDWMYDNPEFMRKLGLVKTIISQYPDIHNRIILHLGSVDECAFNIGDHRYAEIYPIFGKIHHNWFALAYKSSVQMHKFQYHIDLSEYQNKNPEYLFSCAQHKPHPHRVSLMLALIETGLIDSGLATWCGSETAWSQFLEFTLAEVKSNSGNYRDLGGGARHFLPILENYLKVHPDIWMDFKPGLSRNVICDTMTHYDKCLFDIVSESTMAPLIFSEKTWRPIIWGKPFVIIGHPDSNQRLTDLGFDCFSDIFNQTVSYDPYDMNRNNPPRHSEIKRQISPLLDIDPDSWADLKSELMPRCIHNQATFIKYIFDDSLIPEFMRDCPLGSLSMSIAQDIRTQLKNNDYFKRFCPNV